MPSALLFDKVLSFTLPPLPMQGKFYQALRIGLLFGLGLAIAWLPPHIMILLIGGGVFLALLPRYPSLTIFGLILVIPFSSLVALPLGGVRIGLMEMILGLGIGTGLLWIAVNPPQKRSRPASAHLFLPFVILLAGVGLSWLNTLSIGASLVETIKWVEMLALYLLIIVILPPRQIKWVVVGILLAGIAQAALGLYQFVFKVGPPGFLLFNGRFLRAYGAFAQPNPYAGYLGLILPLGLALTLWSVTSLFQKSPNKSTRRDFKGKIFLALLLSSMVGVLLVALFASQSRGAWLAFAAAAAATIILSHRKPGLIVAALAVLIAGIGLVGAFEWNINQFDPVKTNTAYGVVVQRVIDAATIATITDIGAVEVNDANFATIERLAHWQAAREMWRDNLWLGVGFGNYATIYSAYAVGRWLDPLGHAHNYLLNIGAEAGLVGIIAYLIFWIYAFRVIWLAVHRSNGFERAVTIGAFGTLIHLHVHNLFDNLYVQGMYLHVAIVLALVSIISHHAQRRPYGRV